MNILTKAYVPVPAPNMHSGVILTQTLPDALVETVNAATLAVIAVAVLEVPDKRSQANSGAKTLRKASTLTPSALSCRLAV